MTDKPRVEAISPVVSRVRGAVVSGRGHASANTATIRSLEMPLIPPQVKPPARVAITHRLPEETVSLLKRYAQFLDSTQEYVVNETLCLAFRRDKEFQAWLKANGARELTARSLAEDLTPTTKSNPS